MTFTTTTFLLAFLPCLLVLHGLAVWGAKDKLWLCNGLLFAAGLVFYLWAGVGFLALLLGMALVCRLGCGLLKNGRVPLWLWVCLVCLPLAAFKYTAFGVQNLNALFGLGLAVPQWALPLGISFYTFQAVSLLVDVSYGRAEPPTLFEVLFYLTFFPTVVSGPIVRFGALRPQLYSRTVTREKLDSGMTRFVVGLAKKLLLANKIAPLADFYFGQMAGGYAASLPGLWLGSAAYTLQIYLDFSGYTDMALGVGEMLGFALPENFLSPYGAASISGFWRRWHITLSQWFRDYVYIPLGGNRVSAGRHLANLLAVWLLTGIWHGANWTFVVWGLGYFALLAAEKYCGWLKPEKWGLAGHLYTLFWVNLLWVVFRADSLPAAGRYLAGMLGLGAETPMETEYLAYLPMVGLCLCACLPWKRWLAPAAEKLWFKAARTLCLLVLLVGCVAALASGSYAPFIYGNF